MFDVLVDTPKKRRDLVLLVVIGLCFLSLMGDLFFCLALVGKITITTLYQTLQGLHTGFYSKLVLHLASHQRPWLQAFTTLDWLTFIFLFGLCLSHQSKESKRVLVIVFLTCAMRILSIAGIGAYLLYLAASKSIGALVVAIHWGVIFLLLMTVLLLVVNVVSWIMVARSYYVNMLSPH